MAWDKLIGFWSSAHGLPLMVHPKSEKNMTRTQYGEAPTLLRKVFLFRFPVRGDFRASGPNQKSPCSACFEKIRPRIFSKQRRFRGTPFFLWSLHSAGIAPNIWSRATLPCAVCFGNPNAAVTKGVWLAVLVLLGVLAFVLGGILVTGISWAKRSRMVQK